jgi:serine acetyltransferase
VKDVPPHAVVVGVPGRVRRPSSPPPFDTYDMWADPAIYI